MIVHRCWVGDASSPIGTWQRRVLTELGHEVVDWNDPSAFEIPRTAPMDDLRQWRRHVTNVMRFAVLHEHGGMYLDHDVIPVRALPEAPWIATHGIVTNSAIALPPQHPFAAAVLEAISAAPPAETSLEASGERLVTRIYRSLGHPVPLVPLMYDRYGRLLNADAPLVHIWSAGTEGDDPTPLTPDARR